MAFSLRAIRAKRPIVKVNRRKVVARLRDVGVNVMERMSDYPTARTSYRRSGDLGKNWTMEGPKQEGVGLVVIAGNKTIYAGFVEGFRRRRPRQRKLFRSYGWPSVEDIGKDVWKKRKGAIIAALQGR
jgi:hypothetical protein